MSFKGTEHYREKAKKSTNAYSDYCDPTGEYHEDVLTLCDIVGAQSQVVEAARALILPSNFAKDQYLTIIRTRDFDALEAALTALEEESE